MDNDKVKGNNFLFKTFVYIAGVFGGTYLFYRMYFLRTPPRNVPMDSSVLVSPANGEVLSVRGFNEESFIETKDAPFTERGAIKILTNDVAKEGTVITIRLQVTDVHYQRSPTSGKVLSVDYTKGSFKNAVFVPKEQGSRFENEHNSILMETEGGIKYKVVQIAGLLARTIDCFVAPYQLVNQGQFIGVIRLGSQVTVVLPKEISVAVKVGDKLIDGETIIGRIAPAIKGKSN